MVTLEIAKAASLAVVFEWHKSAMSMTDKPLQFSLRDSDLFNVFR